MPIVARRIITLFILINLLGLGWFFGKNYFHPVPVDVTENDTITIIDQGIREIFPSENIKLDMTDHNRILIHAGNILIKVGDSSHIKDKLAVLRELVKVLDQELNTIEYIDIRTYKTPAVKKR